MGDEVAEQRNGAKKMTSEGKRRVKTACRDRALITGGRRLPVDREAMMKSRTAERGRVVDERGCGAREDGAERRRGETARKYGTGGW